MKILVCGSRDWTDRHAIFLALGEHDWHGRPSARAGAPPPTVIHGAARGADTLADGVARQYGFPVQAFPADWETHGKRAGFLRNVQMLAEQPDLVLAFQVNGSRGTQHTIDEARRRGIPVEVHTAQVAA